MRAGGPAERVCDAVARHDVLSRAGGRAGPDGRGQPPDRFLGPRDAAQLQPVPHARLARRRPELAPRIRGRAGGQRGRHRVDAQAGVAGGARWAEGAAALHGAELLRLHPGGRAGDRRPRGQGPPGRKHAAVARAALEERGSLVDALDAGRGFQALRAVPLGGRHRHHRRYPGLQHDEHRGVRVHGFRARWRPQPGIAVLLRTLHRRCRRDLLRRLHRHGVDAGAVRWLNERHGGHGAAGSHRRVALGRRIQLRPRRKRLYYRFAGWRLSGQSGHDLSPLLCRSLNGCVAGIALPRPLRHGRRRLDGGGSVGQ